MAGTSYAIAERAEYDPKVHCTANQAAAWVGFAPHYWMYKVAPVFKVRRFTDGTRTFFNREDIRAIIPKIKARLTESGTIRRGTLTGGKGKKKRRTAKKRVLTMQHVNTPHNGSTIPIEISAETVQQLIRKGVPIKFIVTK